MLPILLLLIQNEMHTTLMFVLFRYTVENVLAIRYALDLDIKEVCIKVSILNICEELNHRRCFIRNF